MSHPLPSPIRRKQPSVERALHVAVAQYLNIALSSDSVWFHPMNEGKRGFQAQRDFKDLGAMTGIPDIVLAHQGRAYTIELKAPNKYPSPEQRIAHQRLRESGVPVVVAHSLTDVVLALESWGVPLRAKVAA